MRCRSSRRSASSGARSGRENVLYIHVTLVPFIEAAGELKTKPTQHSVNELRRIGIHPDIVVCRSHEPLSQEIRDKIALFADVDVEAVIANPDVPDVYLVPPALQAQGLDRLVCEKLGLAGAASRSRRVGRADRADRRAARATVEIALVGKYVKLQDAYLSVHEALKHARHPPRLPRARRAGSTPRGCRSRRRRPSCEQVDGVLVPGGFGSRGWEGKILACRGRPRAADPVPRHLPRHARRRRRSSRATSAGLDGANSTEMDPETPYPVIDLLPEQKEVEDLGGTMRLGAQAVELVEGTRARERLRRGGRSTSATGTATRSTTIYRERLVEAGLVVSGTYQDGRLVEIVELPDHPWFVAQPVPPRVQVAADAPGAALPRLRRRRARAGVARARRATAAAARDARAASRAVRRIEASERGEPRPRRSSSSWPRSRARPGEERAVADYVLALSARARARAARGRRRPRDRLDDRQHRLPPARPTAPGDADHALRAPRHGAAAGADRARSSRTASSATRPGRSSAPTTRRRSRRCSRRRGGSSPSTARTPGSSSCFTPMEEVGLLGASAFDLGRLAGPARLRLRPGGADRRGHPRRARTPRASTRRFTAAPRTPGIAPEEGRSAIVAAARAIADLPPRPDRRGDDRERRASISGGTGREHRPRVGASSSAEARSHDERSSAELVAGDARRRSPSRPSRPTAEVETKLREIYRGYRFRRDDAGRAARGRRARALRRRADATLSPAAAPTRNVFNDARASPASTSPTGWPTSTRRTSRSPSTTSRRWSTSRWRSSTVRAGS